MLLSLRKNGLTSLFKEVRVFKDPIRVPFLGDSVRILGFCPESFEEAYQSLTEARNIPTFHCEKEKSKLNESGVALSTAHAEEQGQSCVESKPQDGGVDFKSRKLKKPAQAVTPTLVCNSDFWPVTLTFGPKSEKIRQNFTRESFPGGGSAVKPF